MAMSKKRKIIIGVTALVVVGGIIAASIFARRGELPEVQTAKTARRAVLESRVTANGEVRPIQFINLTAEVAGRVTDVFVKEGDQVKKGVPLLRVDPTQQSQATAVQQASLQAAQADVQNQSVALQAAENTINNMRAALMSAQADLERARVEQTNADIELKRNAELVESEVISRSVYDSAKARYDSATASVNAARARVDQAQVQVKDAEIRVNQTKASIEGARARVAQAEANLRSQQDLLSKTTQYATINGVVVGPIIQVGQFALANLSSTALLIIADMSTINVEVRVDETDVANVKTGQRARVKVDALGEKEIEGEVTEIAASAVTRSGQTIAQTTVAGSQEAKDFKVVIRLVNMSEEVRDRLRPGMSATATINTDWRENVIAIPLQALVEREAPSTGPSPTPSPSPGAGRERRPAQRGVFVVENGKAVFKPVTTGITGENDIEITSGLDEGTEIITGPYRQLRTLKDNMAIKREDANKRPGASGSPESR
ncbi:MAG: efflux RND transporter periplasmic adaptor subunit [Blastocatellales bacterium]|nr:efflux RND transporter periplasmic adaptor subunit [Blastocatellales bacterium]